jgi:hypothetical protein
MWVGDGVVGDVAEVLRARCGGRRRCVEAMSALGVGGLVIVALLIPAPVVAGTPWPAIFWMSSCTSMQVEGGVVVGGGGLFDVVPMKESGRLAKVRLGAGVGAGSTLGL